MIWATVSYRSCFCWLCGASPSLAAKNIISLILVLTIWWCPCVQSSLVLLEEGVCYDQCIFLAKLLGKCKTKSWYHIHQDDYNKKIVTSVDKDMEKLEPSCISSRNANLCSHFGEQFGSSLNVKYRVTIRHS